MTAAFLSLAKTEVRESKIRRLGLFAIADIAKEEIVAVKGGHIANGKTLRQQLRRVSGHSNFKSMTIC
jgi:hypothetical protein